MPCCASQVVLRTSPRGTPYFAHKQTSGCAGTGETETHRHLKALAVRIARANGWEAATEVEGLSPSGETWVADVMARRAGARVAVEIQWSPQTDAETLLRQARYAANGVRCLWLFRQPKFPISYAVPAARIAGNPAEGFTATLPGDGGQCVELEDFLAAAFRSRLRFGISVDAPARLRASKGHLHCWACGAETNIITRLQLIVGPHEFPFSVPDLTNHPELYDEIRRRLPNLLTSSVKLRSSETQKRRYLSNGCQHCDAFIGEFHEHDAWDDQSAAAELPVSVHAKWLAAIKARFGEITGWAVYEALS